jgi:predicted DNA-binding protein with PD1-like motif
MSNNGSRTAIAFQTTELPITECDIFMFFHIHSTFGTGNGNDTGGIFLSGVVRLIDE